jgi:hypothetical protein
MNWAIGVVIAVLAAVMVGCGVSGTDNSGAWFPAGDNGQVWCVGNSAGGLSCDWEHEKR